MTRSVGIGALAVVVTVLAFQCIPLLALPAFGINIQSTEDYPWTWITVSDNQAENLHPLAGLTTLNHGPEHPRLTGSNVTVDRATADRTLGPNSSRARDLQSTLVPEPVTIFLGGAGLLMLVYAARRRLFGW